ncbi:hypothetical protein [Novosphingobium sp. KN65.2]|uniref:hypothetical protein n=1 Tax=Novosphingobium sp. KN65.2 TaxID=1478134 RepID=UPI0005E59FBB|nr:hypothetical protein [Novosphingobium sp. KN65.2]CDO34311.1 hypothetical protein SPHV1_1450003 [Novosphingobium sp. KN65.2]
MSLEEQTQGQADGDSTSPEANTETQTRDYEAEARSHGWTPKDDFKGDPSRWVDAETFVKRADEVMPFLKKQNAALKREIDDMKRQQKKAADFFSKAEERAYNRAMTDLQAKMDEAVESGDRDAARKVLKDMDDLKSDFTSERMEAEPKEKEDGPEIVAQAQQAIRDWIDGSDWYFTDEKKTKYADMQSDLIIKEHGQLHKFPGGIDAALAEIDKRVQRKFSERPPVQTSGSGNRSGSGKTGRGYADLPADAKRLCDKWVNQGLIKSREDYVRSYQWD